MNPDDTPGSESAPDGRRRLLIIGAIAAAVLVVWSALGVTRLFEARTLALSGLAELESVRGRVDVDAVTEGDLIPDLVEAWDDFKRAADVIRSPLVAPLRLIPGVRTQVQSAEALSSSASLVTGAFTAAATDVSNIAAVAGSMNRSAVAQETLGVVRRADAALAAADLGPSRWLIGSLADARRDFAAEIAEAQQLLGEVEAAAAGVAEFLEGPTTYLLLAANNAEMQAGSGSYLQVGVVEIVAGDVTVDELRPAGDLLVERGAVTIADADLDARWGWLDMAVDWRNLSASPRFPANAAVAADMWNALTGQQVEGVMVLDPVGLATLMSVTGAVEVDGRTIEADAVIRELLFDQYWEEDVAERRDRLEEIARAALDGLDGGGVDLVTLAREVQDAAAARHMLAWSSDPAQQTAWEAIGLAGNLQADSVAVAILNRGANKLDPFLTVSGEMEAQPAGDGYEVTLRVTVENSAQLIFPSYVLGPAQAFGYEPGSYVGILSVNLPGAATGASFAGDPPLAASGPDGVTQVLATAIEVPAGETLEHEVTFTLPDSSATLNIEPSARVPKIRWTLADNTWLDTAAVTVDLATGGLRGIGPTDGLDANVSFTLDPLRNPTAPLPSVGFNSEVETTVEVQWLSLQDDPPVDLWERAGSGEWALVGEDVRAGPVPLTGRPRNTELCYRTALSIAPEQFSAVECLTIPGSIGYLELPGSSTTYLSAPDFVGSGPLDVRALVAPVSWQPDFWQMVAGQYNTIGNDRSWRFGIDVFSALIANFSPNGRTDMGVNQFFPESFRAGSRQWVRMTIDPAAGEQRYWTSLNGSTWAQLGDTRTFEPFPALHNSRGPVFVGTDRRGSDNPFAGKLYYLEVRDGIDGPIIANLDFRTIDQRSTDSSWVDDYGNTFSVTGSGWEYVSPEG